MSSEWISVEDRLPDVMEKVLVNFIQSDIVNMMFVAWMDNDEEWNLYYLYKSFPVIKELLRPTHWMPLPKLPKE